MKNLFLYVFLLISATVTAQTVGTGGTRPDNPGIIEKGRVSVSTSTGKSLWTRLKRTNNLGYVNGVFTWIETDGVDSLSKSANLDTRYLQTSSASTTYVPFTGGTLLGPLTLANSVRVGGTGSIDNNTYLGKNTLISRTSGTNNTAIGQAVLSSVTSGSNNTVVGNNSGASISTGQYNTIIGAGLTSGLTVGSYNTIIGAGALPGITSGMSNTLILADGQGNRRLNIFSDGNAMIGTNSYYGETRLGVFGGVNGANVDIRGNSGAFVDQSTLEVEGNDYDTNTRSAFLQYRGSTYTGTSNGFPNNNLARLVMNGDNNLIMTGLAKPLVLGTNFTSRMVIDTVGNVGIGTALPTQRLTVLQSTGSSVPSIGSAGGHLLLTNGTYGLMQGVNTAGNSWLQAARTDGIATNYNILLNPNGGNIGIGGSPNEKLHVYGKQLIEDSSGVELKLYNTSDANRAGFFSVTGDGDFSNRFVNIGATSTAYGFRVLNGATELLRILNNGNVGFGTIAPTTQMHIKSANPIIRLEGNTTSGFIDFNSTRMNVHAGSGYMSLTAGDAERVRIMANGNTGIGTAAPISTLHAVSQATAPKEVATIETSGVGGKPYLNFRAESVNMGYVGWGASSNKMFMMNYNNASVEIGTNSVSRVAVTGTGAVGVGTTNPLSNLHLNSTTADVYSRFTGSSSTNGGLMIGVGTVNQSVFLNRENTDMEFYTNNTLKTVIKADGKVGIGTALPLSALHVVGEMRKDDTNGYLSFANRVADGGNYGLYYNSGSSMLQLYTNSTAKLNILSNGNIGAGTLTPNKKMELVNAGEVSLRLNNTGANTWDVTNEATQGAFQLIRGGSNVYFHISNIGNTGIGTTSPEQLLSLQKPSGNKVGIVLEQTGIQAWRLGMQASSSAFVIDNATTDFTSSKFAILSNGNIGIGTVAPNAQLQLTNTTVNRKIVLYEGTNNDHQFYGFGVNAGVFRYQVNGTQDAHVFYAGAGSTTSQELFRISGDQTVTYVPLTTAQINALVKATGKVAYNSDTDKMVYCTGTSGVWKYFDGSNM